MAIDFGGIAAIVTAIGVIIVAYFQYRTKIKEKEMDQSFAKYKDETDAKLIKVEANRKNIQDQYAAAYNECYGYLYDLMMDINADRIAVIQPHPVNCHQWISISMEVVYPGRDVGRYKKAFQYREMSDYHRIINRWTKEDFIDVASLAELCYDKNVYASAYQRGVKSMIYKRMLNGKDQWTGTLRIDFTHQTLTKEQLLSLATRIDETAIVLAPALPDYDPVDPPPTM